MKALYTKIHCNFDCVNMSTSSSADGPDMKNMMQNRMLARGKYSMRTTFQRLLVTATDTEVKMITKATNTRRKLVKRCTVAENQERTNRVVKLQ